MEQNIKIDDFSKIEEDSYQAIIAAIENIPPCFPETKRNIKNKIDEYIQIQKGSITQMSKIYNKYIELKSESNYQENTLYLFKSGLFFIFIDKDAQIISPILNLKLGMLNDTIVKCGFPVQSLQKYLNLMKNTPYHIEIVSFENKTPISTNQYLYYENMKAIIDEILHTNVDTLSISQAFDFLYNIQSKLSALSKEYLENEAKE